jgi:hypothetical protein
MDEINNPNSCFNKAADTEMLFVLLGRDIVAADTIEHWCDLRIKNGKNQFEDKQIQDALECAEVIRRGLHGIESAVS